MRKPKDSFIPYYNQFKDKIFNYFLYRVGFDKTMAEDLTSEVFIKAFKNFDQFDESKKFQSWIYMIAHNHLVNHYKSDKHEVSLELVEDFLQYLDKGAEEKYELERILKIISSMDKTDSEILQLKLVDELNNQEIADILEKEEGAIRTQISRSLSKLREILNSNPE